MDDRLQYLLYHQDTPMAVNLHRILSRITVGPFHDQHKGLIHFLIPIIDKPITDRMGSGLAYLYLPAVLIPV